MQRDVHADLEARLARAESELSEARGQQGATADVLKVISGSSFDLQVVFDTLVESAARLCRADKAVISRLRDDSFAHVAAHGFEPAYFDYLRSLRMGVDRRSTIGREALERKVVHIPDVLADPEHEFREAARIGGFRTVLGVPFLREGMAIGALFLTRSRVEPFTQSQIDLVTTFADQAVIAIENARLVNELRESLERQTATSEVLQVISGSPGDLASVFRSMLEQATRICEAKYAVAWGYEHGAAHIVASIGIPTVVEEFLQRGQHRPGPLHPVSRMLETRQILHIPDFPWRSPGSKWAASGRCWWYRRSRTAS